jgi:IS5 family transposase
MYMQYFLGYSSFTTEAPFDASLFVGFRNRMGLEQINAMNNKIHALVQNSQTPTNTKPLSSDDKDIDSNNQSY